MAHHRFGFNKPDLEPGEIVRDLPPGGFPGGMSDLWPMMGGPGHPMVHMPPGMLPGGGMPPHPGMLPPGMMPPLPPHPHLPHPPHPHGGITPYPTPEVAAMQRAMFHHAPHVPYPHYSKELSPPQMPPQNRPAAAPQQQSSPRHPPPQLSPAAVTPKLQPQLSPAAIPSAQPQKAPTPPSTSNDNSPSKEPDENALDAPSAKGIFGWTTIDKISFPYLVRDKKTYLSVRMVEQKILSKYPSVYPEELKKRPPLMSHYITAAEAKLLNEINIEHCAYEYGTQEFKNQKDLIVSVADFEEFYSIVKKHFPDHVIKNMRKTGLSGAKDGQASKPLVDGGWLQINNTVVPYVIRTNMKMLPLAVIRYAAGLLTNTKVEGISPTPDECAYLNHSCSKAGLKFNFEESSKLLAEPLLFTYTDFKPSVTELPKDDPFSYAQYQDTPEKDKSLMQPSPVEFGALLPTTLFSPGLPGLPPPGHPNHMSPNMQHHPRLPLPPDHPHRFQDPAAAAGAQGGNFWMGPHMGIYPGGQPAPGYRGPPPSHPPIPHGPPAMGKQSEPPRNQQNRSKASKKSNNKDRNTAGSSQSLQALQDLTQNYQDQHSASGCNTDPNSYSRLLQNVAGNALPEPCPQGAGLPRNPFPPSSHQSAQEIAEAINRLAATQAGGSRQYLPSYEESMRRGPQTGPPPLVPISSSSQPHHNPTQDLSSIPPLVIAPTDDGPEMTSTPDPTNTQRRASSSRPPSAHNPLSQATSEPKDLSEAPVSSSSAVSQSAVNSSIQSSTPTSSTTPTKTKTTSAAASVSQTCSSTVSPPAGKTASGAKTPALPTTTSHSLTGDKIRPVEYHHKTISCLVKKGENYALVEALSRVYFSYCSLEEFTYALDSVLHMDIFELSKREEQSFITFYGLPTNQLKCNKIIKLDTFDKYMPQLKYMFKEKQNNGEKKTCSQKNTSSSPKQRKESGSEDSSKDNSVELVETVTLPESLKNKRKSPTIIKENQDSNNNAEQDKTANSTDKGVKRVSAMPSTNRAKKHKSTDELPPDKVTESSVSDTEESSKVVPSTSTATESSNSVICID